MLLGLCTTNPFLCILGMMMDTIIFGVPIVAGVIIGIYFIGKAIDKDMNKNLSR